MANPVHTAISARPAMMALKSWICIPPSPADYPEAMAMANKITDEKLEQHMLLPR
jgi:hypothetical protein